MNRLPAFGVKTPMRIQIAVVLISLAAGVAELDAQTSVFSPDFQSTIHVFPQFVDGAAGGKAYTSTFQISATEFYGATRCTLALLSISATTLIDARGVAATNTVFNFILGASGWQIFRSQGALNLKAGSAVLQCDRAVTAHLIYGELAGGKTIAETTVSAAPSGRMVQILADERNEARLGLAIANPFSAANTYKLSVLDIDGRLLSIVYITVGYGQSFTRFLDEIAAVPEDHRGLVLIESFGAADVYAAGLRFTGDSFTAIPAMVRR